MSCQTCGHTMELLGYIDIGQMWWCPRCGTLFHDNLFEAAPLTKLYVPKLVDRCRTYERDELLYPGSTPARAWHRLGIAESINPPETREPRNPE